MQATAVSRLCKTIPLIAGLLAWSASDTAFARNVNIASFAQAKRHLRNIYDGHSVTIYSQCAYDEDKAIDYAACTYQPRRPDKRGGKVEWEHVVPAAAFGRSFTAWRDGDPACVDTHGRPFRGRHCAAKVSTTYRRIEADLHNLFPEIGEINAMRANLPIGPVADKSATLAGLTAKIGGGAFEPPARVKGDVARAHLYMDDAYPELQLLSPQRRKLFVAWSRQDPVDAWECERAARIARVQGNPNPFVAQACPNG